MNGSEASVPILPKSASRPSSRPKKRKAASLPVSVELGEVVEVWAAAGVDIVPCRPQSKTPAYPWGRTRRARTSEELFTRFDGRGMNAAAVMGSRSRGLAVIDFDDAEAYHQWKATHPEDAARIPTVKTSRGFHLWIRMKPRTVRSVRQALGVGAEKRAAGAIKLTYGELRADSGCLSMVPGSTHEDGTVYRWAGEWEHCPPQRLADFPIINPLACGLIEALGSDVEADMACPAELPEFGSAGELAIETIEDAITQSLPERVGERNACVFLFARMLKTFEELRGLEAERLETIVRSWHGLAVRRCRTKRWAPTWDDFRRAWVTCKPYGEGSLRAAAAYAQGDATLDLGDSEHQLSDQEAKVLKACLHLQRQRGDRPMFLSARDAGKVAGVSGVTGWRILRRLVEAGLLAVREVGRRGNAKRPQSGRATEFIVNGAVGELKATKSTSAGGFEDAETAAEEPQKTPRFPAVKHMSGKNRAAGVVELPVGRPGGPVSGRVEPIPLAVGPPG